MCLTPLPSMNSGRLFHRCRTGAWYNTGMYWIAVTLMTMGIGWPWALMASDEATSPQPSARERLGLVLDAEGGIRAYAAPQGNVETVTVLPTGGHTILVQPPQGPSVNPGTPLQLNQRIIQFPPALHVPAQRPAPEFPQRAR